MLPPVLITTPYPTLDETAKLLGMSDQEVREVTELMESILRRSASQAEAEAVVAALKLRYTNTGFSVPVTASW